MANKMCRDQENLMKIEAHRTSRIIAHTQSCFKGLASTCTQIEKSTCMYQKHTCKYQK